MTQSNQSQNNILQFIHDKTINGTGDSEKHLLTLYSLVIGQGSKNILELGVRDGGTTTPLLAAAQITGGHLTSIDINEIPEIPPGFDKTPDNWTRIQMNALDYLAALTTYSKEKFDFIYLDDWHSFEHVSDELRCLDKLVGPSSIIVIHDLMYNTEPFYHTDLTLKDGQWANGGPYRAVAELDNQFWEFATLPWNNGLTILRKKYSGMYHKI